MKFSTKKYVKSLKKRAFTLAEVLLTLTIIGVVLSLTIPSLFANVQQSQFNAGVNNIFQQLSTGLQAIQTNGGMLHTGITGSTNSGLANDFCNVMSCTATGSSVPFAEPSYLLYRSTSINTPGAIYPVMLSNGVYLYFFACTAFTATSGGIYGTNPNVYPGTVVGWMDADINGNAAPNMWGEDLYVFYIALYNGSYSIIPAGPTTDTTTCTVGSTAWQTSQGCTYQRLYNPSTMQ